MSFFWVVIRNPLTNSIIFQDGHIAPASRLLTIINHIITIHINHISIVYYQPMVGYCTTNQIYYSLDKVLITNNHYKTLLITINHGNAYEKPVNSSNHPLGETGEAQFSMFSHGSDDREVPGLVKHTKSS